MSHSLLEYVKEWRRRNKKNFVFDVVICCQGQPFHHYCNTLVGALFTYTYHYLKKRKYGTMNFTLKQEFK